MRVEIPESDAIAWPHLVRSLKATIFRRETPHNNSARWLMLGPPCMYEHAAERGRDKKNCTTADGSGTTAVIPDAMLVAAIDVLKTLLPPSGSRRAWT